MDRFYHFLQKIEDRIIVRTIRDGLVSIIPVLMVGAFSLVFMYFPVVAYQSWVNSVANGFVFRIFSAIYAATFGMLSVYMTISLSHAYFKLKTGKKNFNIGGIATALCCFFILAGAFSENFSLDVTGPKAMLVAIIASLAASACFDRVQNYIVKTKWNAVFYTKGSDASFNEAVGSLAPMTVVVILFAVVNGLVTMVSGEETFQQTLGSLMSMLFSHGETGFLKGLGFVLFSSILWMMGIHGGDALEGVASNYFIPLRDANAELLAAGQAPTHILTKEFFDCFVLMGGCGTTICLLIAILICSRDNSVRRLAKSATLPLLFNINEMMVFGLPIIFNPIMCVPFLLTPVVCYSVSYFALWSGMVPLVTNSVQWTTPVLLGGYAATGSVSGSILQLVNIMAGVAIYTPFVLLLDRDRKERNIEHYNNFVSFFREREYEIQDRSLLEYEQYHDIAKMLIIDFKEALDKEQLKIYYQPQYSYDGECFGVEALLRWKHPSYNMIYPPLIMKIADECGLLEPLEEYIFESVLHESGELEKVYGKGIKISINITGKTIVNEQMYNFLRGMSEKNAFKDKNICLEITEQNAVDFTEKNKQMFREIREFGIHFVIDDFSMGQTSIEYIKDNLFDIIKLDGSLVKDIMNNSRTKEIISSLVQLAKSLDIGVIAEYVETEEQKDALHKLGCDSYQGYLYSAAVPLDEGRNEL